MICISKQQEDTVDSDLFMFFYKKTNKDLEVIKILLIFASEMSPLQLKGYVDRSSLV